MYIINLQHKVSRYRDHQVNKCFLLQEYPYVLLLEYEKFILIYSWICIC